METGSKDTLSWLHGLEDFFKFTNNYEEEEYARLFLNLNYADDPFFPLKKLLTLAHKLDLSEEEYNRTISLFLNSFKSISTDIDSELDLVEWNKAAMTVFPDNELFSILHKYFRSDGNNLDSISDAFSRGQVQSKIWLTTELAKIKTDFDMVYILAGWFGQLTAYLDAKNFGYNKIRVMDIDPVACEVSDKIFNASGLEDYKIKSVEYDITNPIKLYHSGLEYNIKNYNTRKVITEKTMPDLIINTSAEHFEEEWYHKFVVKNFNTDPLYVIQTNNLFDVAEHVNCVHSIDHMKKKYPMSRIEFEGELQLKGYKRFMLIGRP